MIKWKDLEKSPPPIGVEVWLTNWKTFAIGKRIQIRNKSEWNYKTVMLHDATHWCGLDDFNAQVMPDAMQ